MERKPLCPLADPHGIARRIDRPDGIGRRARHRHQRPHLVHPALLAEHRAEVIADVVIAVAQRLLHEVFVGQQVAVGIEAPLEAQLVHHITLRRIVLYLEREVGLVPVQLRATGLHHPHRQVARGIVFGHLGIPVRVFVPEVVGSHRQRQVFAELLQRIHRSSGRTILEIARLRNLRLPERQLREQAVGQGLRVEQAAYQLLRLVAVGLAEVVALGRDQGLVLGRDQHAEQLALPLRLPAPAGAALHIADGLQHALPLQGQVQGRAVAHLEVLQRLHGLVVLVDADRRDVVRRNVARGDGITPAQQIQIFDVELVDGLAVVEDAPVVLHLDARQAFDDVLDAPVRPAAERCHVIQQRVAQRPDGRHLHHHLLQLEGFLAEPHVHRLRGIVHGQRKRRIAHAGEYQAQRLGQRLQLYGVTPLVVGNGVCQHPAVGTHRLDHRARQRLALVRPHRALHLRSQATTPTNRPQNQQDNRTPHHPPTPVLSGYKTFFPEKPLPQNHRDSWAGIPSLPPSSRNGSYSPTGPC